MRMRMLGVGRSGAAAAGGVHLVRRGRRRGTGVVDAAAAGGG